MSGPRHAGPDRAQAVDRLVALIAQGREVLPGERVRPRPTDAYVTASCVDRIGNHPLLGPPKLDEAEVLLVEARVLLEASAQVQTRPDHVNHLEGVSSHGSA
ncbi:hypothetical protein [Actinomadura rubrisoli]|uniref:Uncharacterized protein n=1 Tax=Actinomadura rubrisoli TaxID=2530368 RepID=A0A4R5CFC4_9ACTN|nr:hypothetical protein [Actinomadura rubrisoli]TDD97719.1 hypothetical protein E1298_01395 [Actinomadura rubrisoli]